MIKFIKGNPVFSLQVGQLLCQAVNVLKKIDIIRNQTSGRQTFVIFWLENAYRLNTKPVVSRPIESNGSGDFRQVILWWLLLAIVGQVIFFPVVVHPEFTAVHPLGIMDEVPGGGPGWSVPHNYGKHGL